VTEHLEVLIAFAVGLLILALGVRRALADSDGRRLLQLGALVVLISAGYFSRASGSRGATQQSWAPVSEAGQFSVMMPAARTHSEVENAEPSGSSHTHAWSSAPDPSRPAYVFRYRELGSGLRYADPQKTLDAMVGGVANTAGGRVTESRPLTLAGVPGRQITGTMDGIELHGRFFVTPTRMYILIRTGSRGVGPAQDPFFTDFTLGPY